MYELMEKFQVFTPEKYVDLMLDEIGYAGEKVLEKYFLENSVGSGNILSQAVKRYINEAISNDQSLDFIKTELEKYFIAFEIDQDVLANCKSRLDELASNFGICDVNWDLRCEDFLKADIDKKFDFIIGNPPYITYQEIEGDDRDYLRNNFKSCIRGKFDYCYAFIEKSLDNLSEETGKMAYLIPNSIFKNVFAANLRNLMKKSISKIIDYKHTHIFERVLTSSSIVLLIGVPIAIYLINK